MIIILLPTLVGRALHHMRLNTCEALNLRAPLILEGGRANDEYTSNTQLTAI